MPKIAVFLNQLQVDPGLNSPEPSHFLSLLESGGIIDVVKNLRCTPTVYNVYKLVVVPSLALVLPRHTTSEHNQRRLSERDPSTCYKKALATVVRLTIQTTPVPYLVNAQCAAIAFAALLHTAWAS